MAVPLLDLLTASIAQSFDYSEGGQDLSLIWLILIICGLTAVGAFLALIFLTRRSQTELQRNVAQGLEDLGNLLAESKARLAHLDSMVIDHMRILSPNGIQTFNVLKQTIDAMESRHAKVHRLASRQEIPDLVKAYQLLQSPLENTGDYLSSVLFSETVVTLTPDQLPLAIDKMIDAVELDLSSQLPNNDIGFSGMRRATGGRRRRFTIRGFLKTIGGEGKE